MRTAVTLADALGLGTEASRKSVAAFLQQAPEEEAAPSNEVPMEDYKFHSNDIIKTLEDELHPQFRQEKVDIDEAEVESIKSYDSFMQEKTHEVKTLKHKLEQAQKEKEDT